MTTYYITCESLGYRCCESGRCGIDCHAATCPAGGVQKNPPKIPVRRPRQEQGIYETGVLRQHGVICPRCMSDAAIDVVALVFVRFTPDGTAADEAEDGSHEFDSESVAQCACGFSGYLGHFESAARSVLEREEKS